MAKSLQALVAHVGGELDPGTLQPGESLGVVWQHLREALMILAAEKAHPVNKLPEDGLTQLLVGILLKRRGEYPFFFQREYLEKVSSGKSPRSDIAVQAKDGCVIRGITYAGGRRFLALEAKRLPTLGTGREREYVQGLRKSTEQGGIARFKYGIHGGDVELVGMIGYVQKKTFVYWHSKINEWVNDLVKSAPRKWSKQDRLEIEGQDSVLAWLCSKNVRVKDGVVLEMKHLWVNLAGQATGKT